ncbi:MAG TPA: prepilin-type N-terminal cleavage/methylation domain-containing protein [Candidatus Saccharimonadales bacterium]|nr:prepilin-type N-terminal cleavage/methylation domain-containing protein [Candidatus Saccharimonadales bacterium]
MKLILRGKNKSHGFTIVELILSIAIFPIIVLGITSAYNSLRRAYQNAREYNEIYAVLSACPELDRALDYSILNGTTNCFPNNSFQSEDTGTGTNTYTPTLTVTPTSSLPGTDPLSAYASSKVVQVSVNFLGPFSASPPVQIKMLITQNGLGQL